jgi:O-antigen/teichoic acid export membrane protein
MKSMLVKYAALIRNSLFNLGGQAITVLAALICIPITFRQLGTERFGLLMLVWSMLSYAVVFDLGTGPAVARAAASSLARDEGRRIAAILKAGITIQLALGLGAALLLVAVAPFLIELLKVPVPFRADAKLAVFAVALALPIVLITQSQQGVLEGLERFDLIAYIRTPVAVATYAIPAIGAVAGWSLASIMFVILGSRVLATLAMHALCRVMLPSGQNGLARRELPGIFRYGRWLAVSGLLTQVLFYFDRFVLSAMHGVSAVAQYAAPYDAAAKLLVLPGSIGTAMFPGLAKDAARAQTADAAARSNAVARMTMILLLPICALLVIFAAPILHLWLGPQLGPEGIAAFRILILATALNAAAYPPIFLIEAFGRSDAVARYYLIEVVAYVPVALYAIWRFGVIGAAWAWVARSSALMLWSQWYARGLRPAEVMTIDKYANAN